MSVRVQSWVWRHSRASGHSFVVLLKIADNADDDGANAWPSIAHLASMCRCSESTVHRAIAELQILGELKVEPQAGGRLGARRDRAPNRYRVVMRYQTDTPSCDSAGSQSDTPLAARGVKSGSTGCQSEPHGVSPVTPNSSLDPSGTSEESVENSVNHAAYAQLCRELLAAGGKSNNGSGETPP